MSLVQRAAPIVSKDGRHPDAVAWRKLTLETLSLVQAKDRLHDYLPKSKYLELLL